MIYDRDTLWAELDKLPLEEVRKRLQVGAYAPAAKAKLVGIYVEQKDADAERAARQVPEVAKLDGYGRDIAAIRTEFRRQLEEVGAHRVRLWYAQSQRRDDPQKYMWMEEWVAEKNAADAKEELRAQAARDHLVDEHNRKTRKIAISALCIAGFSALIAFLAWLLPRQQAPIVVPPAQVILPAPAPPATSAGNPPVHNDKATVDRAGSPQPAKKTEQ